MEKNFGPLWFRYRQISLYYGHTTRSHRSWIGRTEATTLHCISKTSVSLLHYKWTKSKWCLCDSKNVMRMHIFILLSCLHTLRAFWRHKKKPMSIFFSVKHHLVIVKRTIVIAWIKDDRAIYRAKHELLGDWRRKQMWERKCARIYMCVLAALVSISGREVWGVFEGSNLM